MLNGCNFFILRSSVCVCEAPLQLVWCPAHLLDLDASALIDARAAVHDMNRAADAAAEAVIAQECKQLLNDLTLKQEFVFAQQR